MKWPHLNDLPIPQIEADISLLIGNNVPDAYSPLKIRTGSTGGPHATKSRLGWIIWNVVRPLQHNQGWKERQSLLVNRAELSSIVAKEQCHTIEQLVKNSINMDFPERQVDDKRENSQEDNKFNQAVKGYIKLQDVHYYMDLPFKNREVPLPNNEIQALNRLKGLKTKLR